mmetsp:Transcript_17946/g.56261  ORF Transcript_17946/g.56261 Transcript_17946/m.56261 type:complete len:495 (+) Transcript_17946:122-1606(+)
MEAMLPLPPSRDARPSSERLSLESVRDALLGRVGPYSGVAYASAASEARKAIMTWMESQELMGPARRAGNYWKIPHLEASLRGYVKRVSVAAEQDGVLEAARELGLLTLPKDVLTTELFRLLHYESAENGDSYVHRAVRRWSAAKAASGRQAAIDELRALCLAGADLQQANFNRETALALAIRLDAFEPLRALLEFNAYEIADATQRSAEPLMMATEYNAPRSFDVVCGFVFEADMLSRVSFRRNDGGYTILHVAAVNDSVDLLERALRYNEFRRRKLLDARAVKMSRTEAVASTPARVTTNHDLLQCALAKASRYGHVRPLEILLRAGATPDVRDAADRTPLHVACEYGFVECVRLLLEFGANPALTDARGRTARDHCLLGMSNKTVRRQSLDQILAGLIYRRKDSNLRTASGTLSKSHVDYKECLRLLDTMEGMFMSNGSSMFGWLLRYVHPPTSGADPASSTKLLCCVDETDDSSAVPASFYFCGMGPSWY